MSSTYADTPVVVARQPVAREAIARGDVTVGSPGKLTTAALALALWAPGARTEIHPFQSIGQRVSDGRLGAGLLCPCTE